MSHWRIAAIETINEVVDRVGIEDLDLLEKEIRAAYPFGERKMWPYKVWLSQVKLTMKQLRGTGRINTKGNLKHYWVKEE